MVLWDPKAGEAGGWLGMVPVLVFPLPLLCLSVGTWRRGNSFAAGHRLAKPFQSRGHQRGILYLHIFLSG